MHENRETSETSETPAVQLDSRSAGEGLSHKARVYVYEESHNGIAPMNHSNKDGKLSAESGEGRGAVDNAANLARCKSLRRQLPVYGRLAYPVRAEATKHVQPGRKSLGRPTA
jgi:hypothetical protein